MARTVKAELLDKLWTRMSERGDFPMLSQALRTTVSAMSDDDLDFTVLVQVVLSDFGLTQKVLRLANSAMYIAFGGNITTVTRALMVLGMDAVGHLVVGLKLVDHFHQSAPRRIDAKLELNRTLLSGAVARQITEHTDLRSAEEAVVCTLMRQIGKLLVAFYLESEWDQLRRKAATDNIRDSDACAALLGVTFEEIGIEAADRWRLPETIRAGMRASDPLAPIDETVPRHVRWLQAVTNYSTEVADALTAQNMAEATASRCCVDIANRYSGALNTDAETLAAMSLALANEESGDGVMREIAELRANADAIARAGVSAEARHRRGCSTTCARCRRRMRSRRCSRSHPRRCSRGCVCRAPSCSCARPTTSFTRVSGSGPNVERDAAGAAVRGRIPARRVSSRDLRIRSASSSRTRTIRASTRVCRAGTRSTFGEAQAFVLLPVKSNDTTVALVYGDWTLPQHVRKISPPEMSALNELTKELSRFFLSANWKEVELI